MTHFEPALDRLVPESASPFAGPARIYEAARYSLKAGGKRIRPVLLLAAHDLCRPADKRADPLPAALAIECVHTYSLIHDDLPCMDNDDLRRGRPTLHRQFDEATALLAGDALLTEAFRLLAQHYADAPELGLRLVQTLVTAASGEHLIGGQMQDILGEKNTQIDARDLEFIHLNKTAAMIEAALVMGGLTANAAPATIRQLRTAGRHLGLAFQIVDDVLDATATQSALGKTPGKDAAKDKTTYVKLHGLEKARQLAGEQTALAETSLKSLDGDTTFLQALSAQLLHRRN